jgi:hypothetical protein
MLQKEVLYTPVGVAIECFKILNKLSPSCLHDLVVFKDCKYDFRYSNIVDIPRVRTSIYGKNSFKYAAAVLWNDLPDAYINRKALAWIFFKRFMNVRCDIYLFINVNNFI